MIENEVSIFRKVKHSNIIQLMEEYDTPNEQYLIMELVTVSTGTRVNGKEIFYITIFLIQFI